MSNIFFIGDTHLGHRNIINFSEERQHFNDIEEHDWTLITLWNSVVNKKDVVYHLGDVVFGKGNMWKLGHLNGIKKLILGNHDQYDIKEYLKYFTKVRGCMFMGRNDAVLTHIPVHPQQFYRWKINIHGHLHSKTIDDYRYANVSCEQINLTPISYDDLKIKIEKAKLNE